MPATLSLNDHTSAIETAGHKLIDAAAAAGEEAPVPTCPTWTIAALLAHQAMIHRWATAQITGSDEANVPNQTEIRRSVDDLIGYTLERTPTAGEAAIDRDLALDGIDELLAGFFTRGRSKLFDGEPFAILVKPADSDRHWHLQVAETLTVAPEPAKQPRLTIAGPAAAIYLGLWNRGDELTIEGDRTIMDRWRTAQKVQWR